MRPVHLIPTGAANLASVRTGLERAGATVSLVCDAQDVLDAERVVLPGVGAFRAGLEALRERELDVALVERVRLGRATLGICLGLQLFCAASEESRLERGLCAVDATVKRFPDRVRVPQMGWNRVTSDRSARWMRSGFAYFANSYRLSAPPPGWITSFADHGGEFVAALEREEVLLCQFHPELSGAFGRELLERWIVGTGDRS
jgi:imidazole glycerol phosphate synthase glutamine amidotransferase subunit